MRGRRGVRQLRRGKMHFLGWFAAVYFTAVFYLSLLSLRPRPIYNLCDHATDRYDAVSRAVCPHTSNL